MDYTLFEFIHQFAGRLKLADVLAVVLGRWVMPLVAAGLVAAILFLALKRKPVHLPLFALASGAGGKVIEQVFDFLTFFPRPFVVLRFQPLIAVDPLDSSFPSGHASFLFGVAFFMLIATRMIRMNTRMTRITAVLSWLMLVLAVLVGLARIYSGVHWPLDIIGGAFAGLLSASILKLILRGRTSLRRFDL